MKRAGGREEATREEGEEEAGKGLQEWNKGTDGEDGTCGRDWAGEGRRAEGTDWTGGGGKANFTTVGASKREVKPQLAQPTSSRRPPAGGSKRLVRDERPSYPLY